jgi:hypothetical protein
MKIYYTALMTIQTSRCPKLLCTKTAPSFLSDLCIRLSWVNIDVARGRWRTYVRNEFAENTAHFVREYQTLLMKRYDSIKIRMFGFRFYPSDLCQWIKDLQEQMRLPEGARRDGVGGRDINDRKRFKWPASCKKGVNLNENPIISIAYKTFCRQNKLCEDDRLSRLQFCMRMRAAWLRLVGCYPYKKGEAEPTEAQINKYLEEQHVYEISLFKKENGANDWKVEPRHVLLWPQRYSFDRLRDEDLRDRRVLVYGAPMRCAGAAANPYLCHPSLQ